MRNATLPKCTTNERVYKSTIFISVIYSIDNIDIFFVLTRIYTNSFLTERKEHHPSGKLPKADMRAHEYAIPSHKQKTKMRKRSWTNSLERRTHQRVQKLSCRDSVIAFRLLSQCSRAQMHGKRKLKDSATVTLIHKYSVVFYNRYIKCTVIQGARTDQVHNKHKLQFTRWKKAKKKRRTFRKKKLYAFCKAKVQITKPFI